jgi:hypothetical protein
MLQSTSPFEPLEPRRYLTSVTLLTHGYEGNITGWIANVADDIQSRDGGKNGATQATMTVGMNSKDALAVNSFSIDSGNVALSHTTNGDLIIKLDWSSVSDGSYSTTDVAAVVAKFMLTYDAGGYTLASLPMHLIGHSRGASLVTAMSQDFGKAGIWVDQQTDLDSHPVDGTMDPYGATFGDHSMTTYDNVIYADSYWRTDGDNTNDDFDGEPVDGAHNLDLNNIVQTDFVSSAHMSVPAYYDGTINASRVSDGDVPIESAWYGDGSDASRPARDQTGFYYTSIFGGLRESDGLWAASSGTGDRADAGQSGKQWANVSDIRILGSRTVASGQSIKLRYIREDRDDNSTVAFFLDRDTNPFNDNAVRTLRQTNLGSVTSVTANRATGSTNGAAAGTYWVEARITDREGHTRYAYSKSFRITGSSSTQAFAPISANAAMTIPDHIESISQSLDLLQTKDEDLTI